MSDSKTRPALPDRLSSNPLSPFHEKEVFEYKIGVILDGTVRDDVEEYCISEGWVKVGSHKEINRKGMPLLVTLNGNVEVYYDNYPL